MNKLSQKYANLNLETDDSIASKEVGLNMMDNSLIGMNNVFRIRSQGKIKTKYLHNFTSKHCDKLKTIQHKNKLYTSLYKPKDDEHAFYIHRINGKFTTYNKENIKKHLSVLDDFLNRINEILEIDKLNNRLKKHNAVKFTLIVLMILGTISTGIYMVLLIFNFMFWVISGKIIYLQNLDMFFYLLILFVLFYYYKFINFYNKISKFIIFKHILKKAETLEKELENWNNTYFYEKNMKAIIAETYDYIQIFYHKSFVYEFQEHK
jgi:hypothetical protein